MAREDEFFRGMGMVVVTGSCHLVGFIKDREAEDTWLSKKVHRWAESLEIMSGVTHNHPQSAYAGLHKSF